MKWTRIALAALALAELPGCGGTDEDAIRLVPARGTITFNGKPMAGATVSFAPDQSNKVSTPGVDSTGPEGTYLIRFKNRSGVSPGKYKVLVTPAPTEANGGNLTEVFKDDPFMARLGNDGLTHGKAGARPKKDAVGAKSEFDLEVPEAGGTFDFDVKSAPAAATSSTSHK